MVVNMKCANCASDALYEYRVTKGHSLFYCNKCLPGFLTERKKAGLLKITPKFTEELEAAISVLSVPATPELETPTELEPIPVKKKAKADKKSEE